MPNLRSRIADAARHIRRHTAAYVVFGSTVLFVVGMFSYSGYESYSARQRLAEGLKIQGKLDKSYTEVSGRSGTYYNVSYTFSVNGRDFSGTSMCLQRPRTLLATVVYDPLDPNNNKLEGGIDSVDYWRRAFPGLAALVLVLLVYLFLSVLIKRPNRDDKISSVSASSNVPTEKAPNASLGFQLTTDKIVWIEREILKLNREIFGEDRPPSNPLFFQTIPKIILDRAVLLPTDVAKAAMDLVKQTTVRLNQVGARKWEVPFRNPVVEFTSLLPNNEPGHIEFGDSSTTIRIHPKYTEDPFALTAILCHELAHFILDHNGLRKHDSIENEKLTDLFVFKVGQGLIYLQGVIDVTVEGGVFFESRLGYLSIEEMAYAHVRCALQFGQRIETIAPNHFRGRGFSEAKRALAFLNIGNKQSVEHAEIILCSNNHVLRISGKRKQQNIRCPKCGWTGSFWLRKIDHLTALTHQGTVSFNAENYSNALDRFRDIQQIDITSSHSYCMAARCLKKLGRHQDAIRELKKILSLCPDDKAAQEEMKTLIY